MAPSAPSRIAMNDIPRVGYGCMSLNNTSGTLEHEAAKAVLRRTIEVGGTGVLWDTATVYHGFGSQYGGNETLVGEVLAEAGNREKTFLVTKFGFQEDGSFLGTPDYARKAIDESIARLGTIPDAWIIHRIPKEVPIKDLVEVLEEVRKAGKTRFIGLGEPSARTLREASKYGKIDFIESEYSPFCLDLEDRGILAACKELDVKVLSFSPLGKGFLTGAIKKPEDIDDVKRNFFPKFGSDVFDTNYRIVAALEKVAKAKQCSPGQLALAWAIAQDKGIIPIPGTTNQGRLEENFGALKVHLTEEDLKELRTVVEENRPEGARYTAVHAAHLDED